MKKIDYLFIPPTLEILVDDDDFDVLSQFKWFIRKDRNRYYAIMVGSYKPMHRLIMKVKDSKIQVDHIDGNGLNNQKSNLRLANNSQNAANRAKTTRSNLTSIYKGVHKTKSGKFVAGVRKDGKYVFQKLFINEIDAAKAYNEAAIKYHGEFAYLNKIV